MAEEPSTTCRLVDLLGTPQTHGLHHERDRERASTSPKSNKEQSISAQRQQHTQADVVGNESHQSESSRQGRTQGRLATNSLRAATAFWRSAT